MSPITLEPVDALTITSLVDDVTDSLLADSGPAKRPSMGAGWRATHALAARFPEAFIQNSVGTRYELSAG